MSTPPRPVAPLELVPIDEPAKGADKPEEPQLPVASAASDAPVRVDRFLAAAAAEFRAGRIDQPLWQRVLEQSGSDEKTTRSAYLRARASALQVAGRGRGASASSGAAAGDASSASPASTAPSANVALRQRTPWLYAALGGALIVVIVTVATFALRKTSEPAPTSAAARPAPATATAAAPAASPRPAIDTAPAGATATEPSLESRVDDLIAAANWNVVVLTANEWTRKEPRNPTAWIRLGMGYGHLGQLDEAIDAAKKAVDVAPGDASAWRYLGEVNVAKSQSAAALQAYEKAAALDERNTDTLVRIGMLNAQLDRFPEASAAFDKVLAAQAGDTDALCGQAFVARQQGRRKDADAIVRDLKASDKTCKELSEALGMPQFASPARPSTRH